MSADDTVLVQQDRHVAVVSLNRPDRHNAATDAMDTRFWDVMEELHEGHERGDVRCVVIRGEGRSLSSGRDTSELGIRPGGQSDLEYIEQGHARTKLLWSIPCPTIVAMKGYILGGWFERALLCDIRIAADDAKMALPEVFHGVVPDTGGTTRLFQIAGHGVASELALSGRRIDAEEALRHGIVSRRRPGRRPRRHGSRTGASDRGPLTVGRPLRQARHRQPRRGRSRALDVRGAAGAGRDLPERRLRGAQGRPGRRPSPAVPRSVSGRAGRAGAR